MQKKSNQSVSIGFSRWILDFFQRTKIRYLPISVANFQHEPVNEFPGEKKNGEEKTSDEHHLIISAVSIAKRSMVILGAEK